MRYSLAAILSCAALVLAAPVAEPNVILAHPGALGCVPSLA